MRAWSHVVILRLLPTVCSVLVNRTIDDQLGDKVTGLMPSYTPTDGWTQGNGCGSCFVTLDASQTVDNTWHDETYIPGAAVLPAVDMTFNGMFF